MPSDEIGAKLEAELHRRQIEVIACLHFDPLVFNSSLEGSVRVDGSAAEEVKSVLDTILSTA